jgi:predicted PhzF superfamily epimerase YddE/YHI9
MDCLVEVADETILRGLKPNFTALAALPVRGVIVTCRGDGKPYDFLSRFFAPAAGVNEDPVTGSAHCALGPYWQTKIGHSEFTADRVILRGNAVMMSRVELRHGPAVRSEDTA